MIIQRDFNVSVEKLGMLTAVNFVTQLLVDLFAAAFVDRLGWRRSICLSHILAVAGFAALSFLPGMIDPYMAVVISVIVYASGSAIDPRALEKEHGAVAEIGEQRLSFVVHQ